MDCVFNLDISTTLHYAQYDGRVNIVSHSSVLLSVVEKSSLININITKSDRNHNAMKISRLVG